MAELVSTPCNGAATAHYSLPLPWHTRRLPRALRALHLRDPFRPLQRSHRPWRLLEHAQGRYGVAIARGRRPATYRTHFQHLVRRRETSLHLHAFCRVSFKRCVAFRTPAAGHYPVGRYAQVAQLDNEDADSNSTARRQFRNVLLSTAEAGVQAFGDGEFVPTRVISVRRAEGRWQLIAL